VAEHIHERALADSSQQQERCRAVSAAVEADALDRRRVQASMEPPKDVGPVGRRPDRRREEQVVILPPIADGEPFFKLADAVLLQRGNRDAGWAAVRRLLSVFKSVRVSYPPVR
jgi:hypothetical protein